MMKFLSHSDSFSDVPQNLDFEAFVNDERWSSIVDLLPDGMIVVDRKGIVCHINSAAESFNEITRSEIVGHSISEFVARSRVDSAALLEAFANGARLNQVVEDTSGRRFLLSTRCARQWQGGIGCFIIVQRNLESIAKISSGASGANVGLAHSPPSLMNPAAGDEEPIIAGEATLALVERGLRAIAMGSRILMLGESGVGKTELARFLHRRSGSADRPFVHVNCGSIPDSLFESEMFGYERGSFTGALSRGKKGLIEAAEGGTLFLDEVGEIPLHCQAKMLQVLEEGTIQRVGAIAPRRLKLQIVAATNRDLLQLVEEGRFRRDLYYRLSVVTLVLLPLRQRPELISLLLERFLAAVNQRRPQPLKLAEPCRRHILAYSYPGNIRELQNVVEHLAVVCEQTATEADLPFWGAVTAIKYPESEFEPHGASSPTSFEGSDLREMVRNFESKVIQIAISQTGSKRKAAERLGVDIATVVRKSKA